MSAPTTQDMSEAMPCKTPVEDLLKAIPQDLVIKFETDDNGFKVYHSCPIGREAHEAVALIETLRAKLAKAQATVPRWIPCSERRPAPSVEVLIAFDNGDMTSACIARDALCSPFLWYATRGSSKWRLDYPTHWQPLPQPPTPLPETAKENNNV